MNEPQCLYMILKQTSCDVYDSCYAMCIIHAMCIILMFVCFNKYYYYISSTSIIQDVQTWFSAQLAFAKFLSKNKGKFLIQCQYHGYNTPSKFPFILDGNLAKAKCTGNRVCTSCDIVVLSMYIYSYICVCVCVRKCVIIYIYIYVSVFVRHINMFFFKATPPGTHAQM